MADVMVNGKKRTRDFPEGAPSCSNIKGQKRSETNFLPNFPDGENADSHESVRRHLESEAKKRLPDSANVKKMMDQTFSLGRKEIVEEQPTVKRMMERLTVLFTESQVWPSLTSSNPKKELSANDLIASSSQSIQVFQFLHHYHLVVVCLHASTRPTAVTTGQVILYNLTL